MIDNSTPTHTHCYFASKTAEVKDNHSSTNIFETQNDMLLFTNIVLDGDTAKPDVVGRVKNCGNVKRPN